MPHGSKAVRSRTETAANLRQAALHARRLAALVFDDRACATLTAYAEKMEARAAALKTASKAALSRRPRA